MRSRGLSRAVELAAASYELAASLPRVAVAFWLEPSRVKVIGTAASGR